jgi:hypothetical protein
MKQAAIGSTRDLRVMGNQAKGVCFLVSVNSMPRATLCTGLARFLIMPNASTERRDVAPSMSFKLHQVQRSWLDMNEAAVLITCVVFDESYCVDGLSCCNVSVSHCCVGSLLGACPRS